MKAMPLPFEEFQGKGFPLDFSSSSSDSPLLLSPQHHHQQKWNNTITTTNNQKEKNCYVGSEPTSVLDTRRSPSPPTSSSTLSSSLNGSGGGTGSTDTVAAAAAAAVSDTTTNNHNPSPAVGEEEEQLQLQQHTYQNQQCGGGLGGAMEDFESESSPGHEQSILGLIMADVDDPSLGLNKLLQTTTTGGGVVSSQEIEFNAGFGVVEDDQVVCGYASFDAIDSDFTLQNSGINRLGSASSNPNNNTNNNSPMFSNSLFPVSFSPVMFQQQQQFVENLEAKPHIFSPQMVMNTSQAQFVQNPALVMPLTYGQLQQHHHNHQVISPPPAKRLNTGGGGGVGVASNFHVQKAVAAAAAGGQSAYSSAQQEQQQQFQLLSQQRPNAMVAKPKGSVGGGDEQSAMVQQAIADQLSKAAELIETGNNPVLAQGILARLNHQLSPLGKPLLRAAFYFKEALQLLVSGNSIPLLSFSQQASSSPFNLIFKIGAYKTFSEISPVLQFANFTCNQAILEATEGFARIHVVDFDIGYGGQWASLMQELALRNSNNGGNGNGIASLKITAFASPATHDEFELSFTQDNLKQFAVEINLPFELEILSIEALNSGSWPMNLHVSDNEAIAVNLPLGSFANNPLSLPLALRFAKQLSPKILVSLERGSDRTDAPFPLQIVHAVSSYTALLESLDAVNVVNLDAMQKIERCLIQPGIEKMVLSRRGRQCPERALPPWRALFSSSGFSPTGFSNFAESQAECLVQRTPVRGFHVEKRQSSLVLCWQRKELVAVSAWRC